MLVRIFLEVEDVLIFKYIYYLYVSESFMKSIFLFIK